MSPDGAPDPEASVRSDEEIEAARILFARPAVFMMGAVSVDGLPAPDLPEVAFAGRSNVGKSSLINALVGQKHLARASNEPGRTREVNFFVVDDQLRLVDLPGYGWARAGKGEVKKFQALGRDYLRGRPNLRRAYLLIDARHGLKDVDEEPMAAFDRAAASRMPTAAVCESVINSGSRANPAGSSFQASSRTAAIAPSITACDLPGSCRSSSVAEKYTATVSDEGSTSRPTSRTASSDLGEPSTATRIFMRAISG